MNVKKKVVVLLVVAVSIVSIMYIGYFKSYIDHDEHIVYFLKKFPTLRMKFNNPFANEGDPAPVKDLTPPVREDLADYCKYRYGISGNSVESLEKCKIKVTQDD